MRNILEKPIITEKSMASGEYVFAVDKTATKQQIARAIKQVFGVDPISVRTLIVKGRTRRPWKKRTKIQLTAWKKAFVRIKEGQKIDIFETGGKQEEKK